MSRILMCMKKKKWQENYSVIILCGSTRERILQVNHGISSSPRARLLYDYTIMIVHRHSKTIQTHTTFCCSPHVVNQYVNIFPLIRYSFVPRAHRRTCIVLHIYTCVFNDEVTTTLSSFSLAPSRHRVMNERSTLACVSCVTEPHSSRASIRNIA